MDYESTALTAELRALDELQNADLELQIYSARRKIRLGLEYRTEMSVNPVDEP